jgi:hypothetical protein
MKITPLLSIFAAAALAAGCNQDTDQSGANSTAASDHTRTNAPASTMAVRGQGGTNLTAMDQGNSDADIKLSASIRQMVVSSTNNFSTAAQNIQIITQNGKVTLRGQVSNDSEKTQIAAIAKGAAGDGNVENDLEVKTNQ